MAKVGKPDPHTTSQGHRSKSQMHLIPFTRSTSQATVLVFVDDGKCVQKSLASQDCADAKGRDSFQLMS